MKRYKITGIGEPFDGLVAFVHDEDDHEDAGIIPVARLLNPTMLFRSWSVPLTSESVYIGRDFLEPYVELEEDDFQTDNPFGDCVAIWKPLKRGPYEIRVAEFQRAMHIRVLDAVTNSTLFSKYFVGSALNARIIALRELVEYLKNTGKSDFTDDLISDLEEIYNS